MFRSSAFRSGTGPRALFPRMRCFLVGLFALGFSTNLASALKIKGPTSATPPSSWCKENPGMACSMQWARLSTVPMIVRAERATKLDYRNRDLYEFGVYGGQGIGGLISLFTNAGITFDKFWGFDSFQGLSGLEEDAKKEWAGARNWELNVTKDLGASSWETLEPRILKTISYERSVLIKGYYNESLTHNLKHEKGMKPAFFVDIDCDLYLSTYQALDWMFSQGLVVPGTYIYYDDVLFEPDGLHGEKAAHAEIGNKYGVTWNKFAEYFFQVKSLRSAA